MSEYYGLDKSECLAHYGVKGMKWGVRKAIQNNDSRALGRQYRKALKKLNKLERQGTNAENYRKRAKRLGLASVATGGLALAGTKGIANTMRVPGNVVKGAGHVAGTVVSALGDATMRAGTLSRKLPLVKINPTGIYTASHVLRKTGYGVKRATRTAGEALNASGNAVENWGKSTSFADKHVNRAASRVFGSKANTETINNIKKITGHSNDTYARLGLAATSAGLAGAAIYNKYRSKTTGRKKQQAERWRQEMGKAFSGTRYANGVLRRR